MNLFRLFTRPTPKQAVQAGGEIARERLKILLAHERAFPHQSDLIAKLREEILAVIGRHVPVERDNVHIKFERGEKVSTLEIGVDMPLPVATAAGLAA